MPSRIPADWAPVQIIDNVQALDEALAIWSLEPALGVDTEANSFFAYHERMCLLQVSNDSRDWIVDPLAFENGELERLKELFEDPKIVKIFHAAEFDLMILRKDLGIEIRGLFDTQVAMTLLRHDKTGLAALIESYYGIELNKKEQRSNWGKRPLTEEQIAYARIDTHFLTDLHRRLVAELEQEKMTAAAEGEFRRQEQEILIPGPPDPERFRKMKAARGLDGAAMARLQAVFLWREEEAARRDVPLFRVLSNDGVVGIAKTPPRNIKDLAAIKGMGWKLAKRYGDVILSALGAVEGTELETKVAKVSPQERRRRRVARENLDAMRDWRKRAAKELGLPSERLMHRRHLEAITKALPRTAAELEKVVVLNDWQRQEFEASLLATLEGLPDPDQA